MKRFRIKPQEVAPAALAILALLPISDAAGKAAAPTAHVSFLKGEAKVLRNAPKDADPKEKGAWRPIKMGTGLRQGDALSVGPKGRVELKFKDGSTVRLGKNSRITLKKAHFLGEKRDKVTVGLWIGRLWAKVTKKVGGARSFEVETQNAVAGVRGTSFTVISNSDLSAMVRVYTGTVGVKKNASAKSGSRKQIAGPTRIDQKQWEEIIATSMKQVKITQLGEIKPAEDFEDEEGELEWAMWNQGRDQSSKTP